MSKTASLVKMPNDGLTHVARIQKSKLTTQKSLWAFFSSVGYSHGCCMYVFYTLDIYVDNISIEVVGAKDFTGLQKL